ncbi:MAG: sulfatase-like hydrolase/transferase, partial [Gemmobacter sp.]
MLGGGREDPVDHRLRAARILERPGIGRAGPHAAPEGLDLQPILPRGRPALEQQSQYAGEVLYTDHEVGELLRAMDAEGLAGDAIVVVTSDHG